MMSLVFWFLFHVTVAWGSTDDEEYTYSATAVTAGVNKITLFWSSEISIGRQTFEVLTMPADVPGITTKEQSVLIENLKSSISYEFTVYLINADNTIKTPVAYTRGQTLTKEDENPIHLTARVMSSTLIRLDWNGAKTSDRPNPQYTIKSPSHSDMTQTTDKVTYDYSNLKPNTTYIFSVHSTRSDGTCYQPGALVEVTTWNNAEDNPSEITAEPCSPTCIRLTWRAPVKSDHSPTLYTILTNTNYESTQQTTATAIDIDQLLPATAYTFHVYSTSIGGGRYIPGAKAMATTFPEDPEYTYELTARSESATKVSIQWRGIEEAITPGRKFVVSTRPAGMPAITTRKQYVQLEGLDPYNFYRFTVYALWANGTPRDPQMHLDYTTPRKDDTLPTELTAEVLSSSHIRLNWKPATRSDRQRPRYTIECNLQPNQRYSTDKTTYDMMNLADGTFHSFQLWSTQSSGSLYLPPLQLTVSTWNIVEKNPTDVVAEACSPTCIRLTWKAPEQSEGLEKFYTIITNSDYNNAQQTEKTTIDIEYLSPGTMYVFTVHSKSLWDFFYQPGGHASARTREGD